jgi:phosphoglycolate phosphatase
MGNLKYNIVLFDLDGTLVNTLTDLTNSLNRSISKFGYEKCSEEQVRQYLGNGYKKLIERSIKNSDNVIVEEILKIFIEDYNQNCLVETKPYLGILELLQKVKNKNIYTAIISNKNDEAVSQIKDLFFGDLIDYSCGMKPGYKTKPNLDIFNDIIHHFSLEDTRAVIVGDSNVDIETANNAHVDCITVTWGFRDKDILINSGAKILCDNVNELYNQLL